MLFIHGSAADHTTWQMQLVSGLRERFALIAYDRRIDAPTIEAHAADAAEILDGGKRALVVGSSFGSVVALELVRSRPELCAGAVLIEPPMAPSDEAALAAGPFLKGLGQVAAEQGGPAAAERFLRTVLGDAAFEAMPRAFQDRSKAKWLAIRADSAALLAYRPRYAELARVAVPVRLVGGERSAPYFRTTLTALAAALPAARLDIIPSAGHMLHAEARRKFEQLLVSFAEELQIE